MSCVSGNYVSALTLTEHWFVVFWPCLTAMPLESGFAFVPILVDRFEFTAVHEERRPRDGDAGDQIFRPQVDSQDTVWRNFTGSGSSGSNNTESCQIPSAIHGTDADFLNRLLFLPACREQESESDGRCRFSFIFPAHQHCQEPILDVDSVRRQDEMEPSPFFHDSAAGGHLSTDNDTYLDFLQKPEKGPKTAVGYFQYLLGYRPATKPLPFSFFKWE